MEHVEELGGHIDNLIRVAKSKQEIALADYRTAVDEERAAKRLQAEHKELENTRHSQYAAREAQVPMGYESPKSCR